jgi:hypothetical protein
MDKQFTLLASQLEDAENHKIPKDVEEIIQEAAALIQRGGVKSTIDIENFTDGQLRLLSMGLRMINPECLFCSLTGSYDGLIYGDQFVKIVEGDKEGKTLVAVLSYHDPAPISGIYDYMAMALETLSKSQWGEVATCFIYEVSSSKYGHLAMWARSLEYD